MESRSVASTLMQRNFYSTPMNQGRRMNNNVNIFSRGLMCCGFDRSALLMLAFPGQVPERWTVITLNFAFINWLTTWLPMKPVAPVTATVTVIFKPQTNAELSW